MKIMFGLILFSLLVLSITPSDSFSENKTSFGKILSNIQHEQSSFIPTAFAQDLPQMESTSKKFQKMDSTLGKLFEMYQNGENIESYISKYMIAEDNGSIRVIIELVPNGTIPSMDIIIEHSSEEFIQAFVPIKDLEKISLNNQIKFISIPLEELSYDPKSPKFENEVGLPIEESVDVPQPITSESENGLEVWYILPIGLIVILLLILYRKRRE